MRLNLITTFAAFVALSCEIAWGGPDSQSATTPTATRRRQSQVTFTGGNGTTCDDAVVIKGATGEGEGVLSERRWLSDHYPGWHMTEQALSHKGHQSYDILTFTTPGGQKRQVCFDITRFFGRY